VVFSVADCCWLLRFVVAGVVCWVVVVYCWFVVCVLSCWLLGIASVLLLHGGG